MSTGKPTVDEPIKYWQGRVDAGLLPTARKMTKATIEVLKSLESETNSVALVRRARWIGEPVDIGGHTAMECSACHKVRVVDDYCSACGAKVDREDEHEVS